MSLLEVVVALSLLGLVLPLLFNLFPASLRAMRRTEMMQQAVTLAEYRMDEANALPHPLGIDLNQTVVLGGTPYQVVRQYYYNDAYTTDMTVSVTAPGMNPLQIQTRFLVGN